MTPAYNAEATLQETLESVIAQSFSNFEAIVVDDGSNDKTLLIAQSFADSDPRIKYISQQNGGTASAYNAGVEESSAEWIVMLSADDLLKAEHLDLLRRTIDFASHDLALITTGGHYLNPDGTLHLAIESANKAPTKTKEGSLSDMITQRLFAVGAAFKRSAWEDVGGFDTELFAEDWWLFLQIIASGHKWLQMAEESAVHRRDTNQKSHQGLEMTKNSLEVLARLDKAFDLDEASKRALQQQHMHLQKRLRQRQILYAALGEKRAEGLIALSRKNQ